MDNSSGNWGDKPVNLDAYLQGKLNREMPRSEGGWASRFRLEQYEGPRQKLIWEAFGYLYDSLGDASGTILIATTETAREIDFRMETFAAATALTPAGQGWDWIIMGSAQQKRMLESDEKHAERKILATMEPPSAAHRLNEKHFDVALSRAGMPNDPALGSPTKKTQRELRSQKRWLGAYQGGWTDTLFILVTRSPCPECSEALVRALGEDEQHHYRHLIVAFCTYYKGGARSAMPSDAFCSQVGTEDSGIELFKIHWTGTADDFQQSCSQARREYWHLATVPTLRVNHPVSQNGLPYDPRFILCQLLPR